MSERLNVRSLYLVPFTFMTMNITICKGLLFMMLKFCCKLNELTDAIYLQNPSWKSFDISRFEDEIDIHAKCILEHY